jgi:hypothetical protein
MTQRMSPQPPEGIIAWVVLTASGVRHSLKWREEEAAEGAEQLRGAHFPLVVGKRKGEHSLRTLASKSTPEGAF